MSQQLKTFLQQIHPVAEDILKEYLQYWKKYQVPRKAMITHKGEVQKHAYFVLEGMQKSYYLHEQMMQKYRPIETLMRKATEHLLAGVIERHYELMAFATLLT